jgi:hypothetical protein
MSRVLFSVVLLTSALATGCAGSRDNLADTALAAASTTPAAPGAPAAPAAAALAAAPAGQAAPDGAVTVVDGNQLAQRSSNTLLCRDLLVRGSNQMRKMCGTPEQWKTYDRREAEAAAEQVRRMQQGRGDEYTPRRR